jgi:hypothetical protein
MPLLAVRFKTSREKVRIHALFSMGKLWTISQVPLSLQSQAFYPKMVSPGPPFQGTWSLTCLFHQPVKQLEACLLAPSPQNKGRPDQYSGILNDSSCLTVPKNSSPESLPHPLSNLTTGTFSSPSHGCPVLLKHTSNPVICVGSQQPTKWSANSLAWNLRASMIWLPSTFPVLFPLPHPLTILNYPMLLLCPHSHPMPERAPCCLCTERTSFRSYPLHLPLPTCPLFRKKR